MLLNILEMVGQGLFLLVVGALVIGLIALGIAFPPLGVFMVIGVLGFIGKAGDKK
jgi:hypothetical protein